MSDNICGIGMLTSARRGVTGIGSGESASEVRDPRLPRLRHSSGSLQNPKLEKPRQPRHSQQGNRRNEPSSHVATRHKRHNRSKHRAARPNRGNHVADPVYEVEERALGLRSGLPLNSRIELRSCTQRLRHKYGAPRAMNTTINANVTRHQSQD